MENVPELYMAGLQEKKRKICKLLFDRSETFHFTISDISEILKKENDEKISLATIYNTIHSFKNKGYL